MRYERLLAEPAGVVAELAARLGVPARSEAARLPEGLVMPVGWDDQPPRVHHAAFDASYYARRRYLDELESDGRAVVSDAIDWDLLAMVGYAPV